VSIAADGEKYAALASLGDDLKYVFIVSAANVVQAADEKVSAAPLDHAKCERCWHVRADVGADAAHPDLCGRCVSNLSGEGEPRACA
jgi:isoleucyl-tRNA synthetase